MLYEPLFWASHQTVPSFGYELENDQRVRIDVIHGGAISDLHQRREPRNLSLLEMIYVCTPVTVFAIYYPVYQSHVIQLYPGKVRYTACTVLLAMCRRSCRLFASQSRLVLYQYP